MQTIEIKNLSEGYHQGIMYEAYEKFTEDISMEEWFESLSKIEKYAVASGKFNQQTCNGGYIQWIDNGYAKIMIGELCEFLNELPQNEEIKFISKHINILNEEFPKYEYGEGNYIEETEEICPNCSGNGELECPECGGEEPICPNCGGEGTVDNEECTECDGEGTIICDTCQNEGVVECEECNGEGTIFEEEVNYHIDDLKITLNIDYDFDTFDSKYFEIEKNFLKICEDYFKSFY